LAQICQEQRIKTRIVIFSMLPTGIYLCTAEQQTRRAMPSRLSQLPLPYYEVYEEYPPRWGWEELIALETLLDCPTDAHGRSLLWERERLSTLIQAMHDHRTLDELIPAVFGVTPGELEADWQLCLQAPASGVGAADGIE
jgi:hypothetical protein